MVSESEFRQAVYAVLRVEVAAGRNHVFCGVGWRAVGPAKEVAGWDLTGQWIMREVVGPLRA